MPDIIIEEVALLLNGGGAFDEGTTSELLVHPEVAITETINGEGCADDTKGKNVLDSNDEIGAEGSSVLPRGDMESGVSSQENLDEL
ncbi:hypothetical protein C4D60_Mb11t13000 [Musa balbisiana]|uniref:Uncharacterized protein n=1 Tax=Musa balbisiana TaxID=52838 RepID=A0A4S8J661_MUSBA|nr:hypothetical protein C4D60_Mb11t13000 [Musa balbisiana]